MKTRNCSPKGRRDEGTIALSMVRNASDENCNYNKLWKIVWDKKRHCCFWMRKQRVRCQATD
jgi:hypothetical protein